MKKIKDKKEEENLISLESKYIQQHLANERTFLAWLRTAISVIGVGFLVTNLHFSMRSTLTPYGDLMANVIGISSVGLGIIVIIMSTISYIQKINSINTQTFRSPRSSIIMLGALVILITLFFGVYFVMVNI